MKHTLLDLDFDFIAVDAIPCAIVVQVETVDSFDNASPETDLVELIDSND